MIYLDNAQSNYIALTGFIFIKDNKYFKIANYRTHVEAINNFIFKQNQIIAKAGERFLILTLKLEQ